MPNTADRLLRLSPADNVAVAITTIEAAETAVVDGATITAADRIPAGHKVALAPIAVGAKVRKYGLAIGSATRDIRPGQHVHTHNLRSDYLE